MSWNCIKVRRGKRFGWCCFEKKYRLELLPPLEPLCLSSRSAPRGIYTHEGCDCVSVLTTESVLSISLHRVTHVPDRMHPRSHIWKPHVPKPWVDQSQGPKQLRGTFYANWSWWINLAACQSFLITNTAWRFELLPHIFPFRMKSLLLNKEVENLFGWGATLHYLHYDLIELCFEK